MEQKEKLLLYKSIALKMIEQHGKEEAYSRIKEAIQIIDAFTKYNEPVGNVVVILGSISSIILQSERLTTKSVTHVEKHPTVTEAVSFIVSAIALIVAFVK